MRSIKNQNFLNKIVFARCDFNVPIKNKVILDTFKIERALATINYLRSHGAKIIIASHLGGEEGVETESLELVSRALQKMLFCPIVFSKNITGRTAKEKAKKLKPGGILLLENLRFEKGEKEASEKFAKGLSELADYFVNEAFSVSHRKHASIALLPKFLPSFAGLNFEKEVEVLSGLRENPKRPLSVVIGGAKVLSKLKVAEYFSGFSDHLLLGGKVADLIMRVKGLCVGKDWPEKEVVEAIKKLDITNPKIHLPIDALASPDKEGDIYVRETGPAKVRSDEDVLDIGEETVKAFSEIIKQSKTVFWSGPMGLFENPKFAKGTRGVAEAIVRTSAFTVAGGGETIASLTQFGLLDKISFVSTGGGAMLHFLGGERMPGLEALQY